MTWGVLKPIATLQFFFFSPNFVWFAITLALYLMFPYDFEAATAWARGWVIERVVINLGITHIYVGFWYLALNHGAMANRKFRPDAKPSFKTMVHNIWYTTLGAVQWSAWECVFIYSYANGYLPYIPDHAAFATVGNATRMVLYTLAVPVFREFHFYWAHRLLHIRVLYKYVHSLHHRNIDPEPYSGLCM